MRAGYPPTGTAMWRALVLTSAMAGCAIQSGRLALVGEPERFAPGVASTRWSDVRLTLSPDGQTALWFSRDRPGGPGGYDIWMSRREAGEWRNAEPVSFNSPGRDFDPAFSADGRQVYFASDRAGGRGGDDLYRVAVQDDGFGEVVSLGDGVNTAGNEWAPMLSPDGFTLLFTSNGRADSMGLDLYVSRASSDGFATPTRLPAPINTAADEFDATFLADGRAIVFSRAADIRKDPVLLYYVPSARAPPVVVSDVVNTPGSDTYAPMLDWSERGRLTFTTRRPGDSAEGVDVYVVRYR